MRKETCKDCICLVADTEGHWVCDERELPIEQIDSCPEGIGEDVRKKFRVMVVSYGYAVVEAQDEEEALAICKKMTCNGRKDFDWSDPDDEQVVEEVDFE